MADVGQDSRLGAQLAVEAVNAAGGIKKTSFSDGVTVSSGPVIFNDTSDNPNASTAMLQILGQKARVVWPRDAAEQRFVFPRPKA